MTQPIATEELSLHQPGAPSALPLVQLALAFYGSKALQSAVELDVFTALAQRPATEEELRDRIGLHPRASRDFLDALVALNLLEREDDLYRPTPVTGCYLNRESPAYLGGLAEFAKYKYQVWGNLTEALRTGKPYRVASGSSQTIYADPDLRPAVLDSMDAVNGRVGAELADALDWSTTHSFVDVGGARGNLAAVLVREHPHLTGICFDRPVVRSFFDEHIATLGLTESVSFHGGDFEQDPLPPADVLILGHVLHGQNAEQRRMLLGKVHRALPAGGRVVIYDRMINNDRRGSMLSLLGSLNMLLMTFGGSEYTPSECRALLEAVGFTDFAARPVAGTDTLVTASKLT